MPARGGDVTIDCAITRAEHGQQQGNAAERRVRNTEALDSSVGRVGRRSS
jgi:hypothetical protein